MDPTGQVAHRFPLVARSRPPCTALSARIAALAALADRAAHDGDRTAASRVHNQAALIASDSQHPDLARTWCHRHAHAYLDHQESSDATTGRLALEPLVNVARLHIRAGAGDAAAALLNDLYQAVRTRTDTVIDGIPVPMASLTSTAEHHRSLLQWLWSVNLADGTRARTTAGRWDDAETHLRHHNGIGRRMLDGRQVAVIAHATRHEHANATRILAETEPGDASEAAVTACLTALNRPAGHPLPAEHRETLIDRYRHLPPDASLIVFRTRLALSIIDAIAEPNHPTVQGTAGELIRAVVEAADGYAARDILAHRACAASATAEQTRQLTTILNRSGLRGYLPESSLNELQAAVETSEGVIVRCTRTGRVAAEPSRGLPADAASASIDAATSCTHTASPEVSGDAAGHRRRCVSRAPLPARRTTR
ncbi:MAG TPA: hypothetical protein VK453_13505 [Micromonosporaceae bacterium]|nr:hypothetical protein [Micromonosporaceae bacterium]